jgi:hypothetical protein
MGVLVGQTARIPMRLILVRVPNKVAQQRREPMIEDAKDHTRQPSEKVLFLADGTILLSTVPRRVLSLPDVLVMARLRWHFERLFRLGKEDGHIEEWRSKKPSRLLTERSATIGAMLMQPWLLHQGCWHDPHRSLFKAAQVLRREINRLLVALCEGEGESTLTSILRLLRQPGGHLHQRKTHPGADQILWEGRDWPMTVFTSCLWVQQSGVLSRGCGHVPILGHTNPRDAQRGSAPAEAAEKEWTELVEGAAQTRRIPARLPVGTKRARWSEPRVSFAQRSFASGFFGLRHKTGADGGSPFHHAALLPGLSSG